MRTIKDFLLGLMAMILVSAVMTGVVVLAHNAIWHPGIARTLVYAAGIVVVGVAGLWCVVMAFNALAELGKSMRETFFS